MKFIKKILFWASFGAGIFIILVLIISLLLPSIIGPEYLKNKIVEQISLKTGHHIKLRSVDIQFFPRLHAVIHHSSMAVPGKFIITIGTLKAYPEILPLFLCKININKLYLDTPRVRAFISQRPKEDAKLYEEVTFEAIEEIFKTIFSEEAFKDTDLALQIRNGKAGFYEENRLYFEFDNIASNIKFSPGWITITLNGKSNFCEKISFNGKIFPYTSTGEGRIELLKLNPKVVFDYFSPNSDLKIDDSQINLNAHFDKKGDFNFYSNFEGAFPLISFQRNAEKLIINGGHFSGNFLADKNGTKIIINKLGLDNPGLSLSGNFSTNKSLSQAKFDLEGGNIDINTTRKAALFLAGNSGTTKAIFDIIKDGNVPFISIKSEAPSVSELVNIENISIRGDILEGKIHVPEPFLELEGVKGNVTVSGGILEGNNLEGRLGNSTAKKGILKLGLSEKKGVFYLDTAIHADLSQLPPVLNQVVKNKTFLYELSLIKGCEGQADGNLIINDDGGGATQVKVDVSGFNLQAVYERFSTPVTIIGEKFFLDDSFIFFKLTNGACGKSSISDLTAKFMHDKDKSFNILSEKSRVYAKDINPFILSFLSAKTALKNISFPGGTVNLNNLEINGPLFAPQEWNFNASGKIENLIIDYDALFRKPATVTSLIFKTTGKKSPKRLGSKRVVIEECRMASGRSNIAFNGNAVLSKGKLQLDLNAASDFLEWSIIKAFAENRLFQTGETKKSSADSFLSGIIKAKVKYLKYGDLTFSPLHTDITLGAGNISFAIEECRIASGRSNMAFNGNAVLSKGKLQLDLNAASDFLEWSSMKAFTENRLFQTGEAEKSSADSFLSGIIKAKVKYLKYGDLTFSPLHTDITLGAGNISFALFDTALCGISLTGILETSRNKVEFRLFPFARDEKFDSSLNCLVNKQQVATGYFSLDGEIFTKGKGSEITGLLNGTLDFKARDGRIYQLGFLSKIFALLNLTEMFRGKIPDLVGEGFAYNSITASGKFENGNFVITGFVIDGASMAIVCTGNIDLNKESVDLVVLISPFKTIDLILKYIPVVTQILDGNIISIPFRVTGKIDNPNVTALSPTAVGSGLLNMLQRTIMLPIKIMQPLNAGDIKITEDRIAIDR